MARDSVEVRRGAYACGPAAGTWPADAPVRNVPFRRTVGRLCTWSG